MRSSSFTTGDRWGGLPVVRRIVDARPRTRVIVTGAIVSTEQVRIGEAPNYRCEIDDGTGVIAVLFLGRANVPAFIAGARCTVEGTAQKDDKGLVVWNPIYRLEPRLGS